MRTLAILTATALMATIACQQKKTVEETASADLQEWPQLDAFHMVMAESFHPYADSGNLEPAREYAAEMASLAEEWAGEPLPEKVDNEDTRALLNALAKETAAFSAIADSAPDDSLAAHLTSLHELFHKIQEVWYEPSHGDGHH
jgi:superfamily I DNA/RNA helicase